MGGTLEVLETDAIPTGTGLIVGANGTVEDPRAPSGGCVLLVVASSPAVSFAGGVASVPEPGTFVLLAVAVLLVAVAWQRRKVPSTEK